MIKEQTFRKKKKEKWPINTRKSENKYGVLCGKRAVNAADSNLPGIYGIKDRLYTTELPKVRRETLKDFHKEKNGSHFL